MLRIGLDEEGGAAGDVGFEEADAFVGGVPGFDDDVVELFAEELVDDGAVRVVDLEEVGEGAEGGRWSGFLALARKMFLTVSVE